MTFKVLCTSVTFGKINQEPYQQLLDAGCEVVTNDFGRPFTQTELIEFGRDADALIVGTDHVPEEVINQLEKVKIIAKHGVGFDSIDLVTTKKRDIFVTNVPRSNSQEVADLVYAFILSLARNIPIGDTETKAGLWNKRLGLSIHNKTLGIIGTGNIGEAVAARASGFSLKILAYDKIENEKVKAVGGEYVSLEKLLTEADFVTLHLPRSADTIGMIGAKELALMKSTALLINTARTELVDLVALAQALADKKIRGYGTDVFSEEPTPHLPIFDFENVVISPHIGATTKEANLVMGLGAVSCVLAVKNNVRPPADMIRNGV